MIEATLRPAADLAELERSWRDLESRSDFSFFLSWTWIGCLAAERFDAPLLLAARTGGRTTALAVLNRRRRRLFLNETGSPDWDAAFIEHNGILCEREQRTSLLSVCLSALRCEPLVLSGVDDAGLCALQSLPGSVRLRRRRPAPYVDFAILPAGPYLDSLSPNTRYQIRRSHRRYAEQGPLSLDRAASEQEARTFLDALAELHQRSWRARNRPGAFANPAFVRFHQTLIERGFGAGEIDLLRIRAGDAVFGYLYNFVHRDHVYAYQSGFDFEGAGPHQKPGLTSHHLAIEMYRARGMRRYDFLAGEDRYKASLANASEDLYWVDYAPRYSVPWVADKTRRLVRKAVRPGAAT